MKKKDKINTKFTIEDKNNSGKESLKKNEYNF